MYGSVSRNIGKTYDWTLMAIYLALVLIGWMNIYSSIHGAEGVSLLDFGANSGKQLIWIVTAIGLGATIIFFINPNLWESGAALFYAIAIVLLIAVIFVGEDVKGSRSWFTIGPIRMQPAEISKITTALLLSYVMSKPNFRLSKPKNFIMAAAIIIFPMLIIVAEKETGSALVYTGLIFMLYREGLSGWLLAMIGLAILLFVLTLTTTPYMALMTLVGLIALCNALYSKNVTKRILIYGSIFLVLCFVPSVVEWLQKLKGEDLAFLMKVNPLYLVLGLLACCIPFVVRYAYKHRNLFTITSVATFIAGIVLIFSTEFAFNEILEPHQQNRIAVWLGMKEDLAGVGYNVNQSKIAIGSGGFSGKGFLNGTQTTYGFVPEQSTDFIFCTVGEEWGFVGCLAVISLYVMLILQIIKDAERGRDKFTRIFGYCLACCLFMHLFINIGMTIGIMPVIGIPLPFLSYGGSSLWSFTAMLAIFIALDHREKRYF